MRELLANLPIGRHGRQDAMLLNKYTISLCGFA